ncbi:hypothetical protein D1872_251830 [compost metagenome]
MRAGQPLQKFEVFQHRVVAEIQLAGNLHAVGFRLHPMKLDAAFRFITFHTIEILKKIEMPPRTAEFAVGHGLKPDFLLLVHHAADFLIFDFL